MPRTAKASTPATPVTPTGDGPLDQMFEDMRAMLSARRAEYQAAAERITDILGIIAPKPRIGRPPKAAV